MDPRPFQPSDRAVFLCMSEEFYSSGSTKRGFDAALSTETFDRVLDHHENLWGYMLLSDEGAAVGYALITSYWCNEDGGNVILLDELYIFSTYRGKGYGKHFMEWFVSYYKQYGVSVSLEVLTSNHHARDLYAAAGFAPDGFEVYSKKL